MRKLICLVTSALLLLGNALLAQPQTEVSGKVTDASGNPISGASVKIKGANTGTSAGVDGSFTISVPAKGVLEVSAVGFETKDVNVGNSKTLSISLTTGNQNLSEVVVTALGIRREKKALGYAVSTIDKKDLELKPEGDLNRVLSGKAAGVNILNTSGLSGSGTNITIRGVNTITGSSQPLFVVDGVPFDAGTNTNSTFIYGNQLSSRSLDLDPNNIEGVSILKGLAATTLYGELGRNGVILITTKNGSTAKRRDKTEISVSQSTFVNTVANLPEYTDQYGGGFDLSLGLAFFSNWGAKFTNPPALVPHPYDRAALRAAFPEFVGKQYEYKAYPNSVKDFFRTGLVNNTSVNAAGSVNNFNYNINYGYLDDKGFTVGNRLVRNTFGIGGSTKLSNKFSISGTFNYVVTDVKSPPTSTSFGSSAGFTTPTGDAFNLTSVFGDVMYTPTAVDLMNLPYENPLDHSHVYYRGGNDIQNPRWTLYNAFTQDKANRAFGNFQIKYEILKGLNLMYRVGLDNYSEYQLYAQNKGGTAYATGVMRTSNASNTIWDHTVLASYIRNINADWNLTVDAGVNSRENTYSQTGTMSTEQLVYGLLDHTNFITHDIVSEAGLDLDYKVKSQSIGAFAEATVGYKGFLYFNVGGRDSWSSTVESTHRSVIYPKGGISFIPTSAFAGLKGSRNINYLKTRIGFSTSAGFPDPYATRPVLAISTRDFVDRNGNVVNTNAIGDQLPNSDLKPELQQEIEAGLEGKFFKNRASLDLTLYKRISKDQILNRDLDPSTGYLTQLVNAGKVTNKGIELGLGYAVVQSRDWKWQLDALYTINESLVSDIPADLKEIVFAGYTTLGNFAINGYPLGVIKGYYFQRDPKTGQRIVGSSGDYLASTTTGIIGDPNPHYKVTGISTLTYKMLSMRMQWDYTCGGDMYSVTSSVLLGRGVTKDTEFDRAAPYILPGVDEDGNPNRIQTSATEAYFDNTIAGGAADETGIYDATCIRLREVSLSFSLPEKLINKTPFGSISLSVSGSNLWYYAPNFPKYVHFDPETSGLGVSNGKGLEFITGPSSRRIGASLRVTF